MRGAPLLEEAGPACARGAKAEGAARPHPGVRARTTPTATAPAEATCAWDAAPASPGAPGQQLDAGGELGADPPAFIMVEPSAVLTGVLDARVSVQEAEGEETEMGSERGGHADARRPPGTPSHPRHADTRSTAATRTRPDLPGTHTGADTRTPAPRVPCPQTHTSPQAVSISQPQRFSQKSSGPREIFFFNY